MRERSGASDVLMLRSWTRSIRRNFVLLHHESWKTCKEQVSVHLRLHLLRGLSYVCAKNLDVCSFYHSLIPKSLIKRKKLYKKYCKLTFATLLVNTNSQNLSTNF